MTGKSGWICISFLILLCAGVLIAGCSDSSGTSDSSVAPAASMTSAAAVYSAGDIIAKTDGGGDQLYVILGYDSSTDKYERAWIYRNSDGTWGHFIDKRTEKSPRTVVEKVYPVKIDHVTVSAVPVVTPNVAAVATITYVGSSPVVSSVSPSSGVKDATVTVTITGKNFQDGATTSLMQPGSGMVTGTATSVSSTSVTTTFNLYGLESGAYNVRVMNPDTRSDTLQNAFTIGSALPVVTSVTPNEAEMNETVASFTVVGQNFKTSGVKVTFILGSTEIDCGSTSVYDSTKLFCGPVGFKSATGAKVGSYSVRVLNIEGQQSGTGTGKFTLVNATSSSN